ncbi:MAG: N-acetylneuraminate synthase family protein [Sedimentisphaerales bacterium]|nr:N-acetylneuraminate synthase family protein [Sedimentisphaerales bacterium]
MAYKNYDIALLFPPIRTWDSPRNFPTGLGLIAARLRSAGYRVAVIDVNGLRLSDDQVLEQIQHYNPAVVGIGGLITTYSWVKRICRRVRQLRPDSKIILGGSVGTSIVQTALENLNIDAVAIGEADDTILELLPALLHNKKIDPIPGIAYRSDEGIVRTPERKLIETLDELPYPAWDLFPMKVYLANPVVGVGKDIDIISSRGCPFNCHYCYRIFGRKFRGRSPEHVVGEMQALKRNYDVDFISFQDDCFVIDKKRIFEICDLIDHEGLNNSLRWSCTGRVTVCDKELLKRMKSSGCVSVSYGIESGSDKILQAMGKGASLAQAKEAIINTRDTGLRCPVSFMIGYPGETRETVMKTVEFCKDLNIPLTALMFTCPYPGTALYEQVKDSTRFKEPFTCEEDFVLKIGDAVDLTVNLTEISNEDLVLLRDEALHAARENYTPPTADEVARQEKELYGEELYQKAQIQMQNPHMQAHRRRHGFNEAATNTTDSTTNKMPGWVDGRIYPYIIAEAGVNHNGQLDIALKLVEEAKKAGADCVKFQAFTADELVLKDAPKAEYQKQTGPESESQYDMLKRYELSEEDFATLINFCAKQNIDFLVTPFSVKWVNFFHQMGVNAFKIGSGNLNVTPLLEAIGQTGLPVIVSTGMAEIEEIHSTLNHLHTTGTKELALLHCVSLYPTSFKEVNLDKMYGKTLKIERLNLSILEILRQKTRLPVGFSDHTQEIITGSWAIAAGAIILEKHFTLDKYFDGPDHKMSLEPAELKEYIELAHKAAIACGNWQSDLSVEEFILRNIAKMSIVSTKPIRKGERFTWNNITIKRPGIGESPEKINNVLSSTSARDIKAGEPVKPGDYDYIPFGLSDID